MNQESERKSYQDRVQESLKNKRWFVWALFAFLAISSVTSFLGGVKSIVPDDSARLEEHEKNAKRLAIELQGMLTLLPVQQSFSDCLDRRKGALMATMEACIRERRQSQVDPRVALGKIAAEVAIGYSDDKKNEIIRLLSEMDYIAYEMQNNQTVMEHWIREGCDRSISITNDPPSPPIIGVQRMEVRCVLAIQSRDEFIKKQEENTDQVSQMRRSFMGIADASAFIVEGGGDTIDAYFNRANNALYSEFLKNKELAVDIISSDQ